MPCQNEGENTFLYITFPEVTRQFSRHFHQSHDGVMESGRISWAGSEAAYVALTAENCLGFWSWIQPLRAAFWRSLSFLLCRFHKEPRKSGVTRLELAFVNTFAKHRGGLTLAGCQTPTKPLCHSPSSAAQGRKQDGKGWERMGWDEDKKPLTSYHELPVTGKTDSKFGKIKLLAIDNKIGQWT